MARMSKRPRPRIEHVLLERLLNHALDLLREMGLSDPEAAVLKRFHRASGVIQQEGRHEYQ
jgi:hypothetical protein